MDGTVTANSFTGDGSGLTGVALRAGGNTFTGNQIVTSGNVGIGATSPMNMGGASYPGGWEGLHTRSLAGNGLNIIQGAASARLHLRADNNASNGSQDFIINNGANQIDFMWLTPGLGSRLSAMTIATNGNVGIGTDGGAIDDMLHVRSSASMRIRAETTVNGYAGFLSKNNQAEWFAGVASGSSGAWTLTENSPLSGSRIIVRPGGVVGIGRKPHGQPA